MPDLDDTLGDHSLRDAFESFRAGSLPAVVPEGADAVRHTVRRRHRNRVAGVAVVAALVVLAGGASAVAALHPAGHTITTAGTGTSSPTPSTGSSPSVGPEPSASASPGSAPDGQIGANELMNATIDVPAWGGAVDDHCASGQLTFHHGEIGLSDHFTIFMSDAMASLPALHFEDVDGDGAKETIVTFWCGVQGGTDQVVALDRDASGNIVTLGQIASTYQDTSGSVRITQVTMTSSGDVQLEWSLPVSGGDPVNQWRTYQWTGSGFEQVDGPTTIMTAPPADKVELTVTAPDATMSANQDGSYGGTLAITVTNSGTQPLDDFRIVVDMPAGSTLSQLTTGSTGLTCDLDAGSSTSGSCAYTGELAPDGTVSAAASVATASGTMPTVPGTVSAYPGSTPKPLLGSTTFKLVTK